MSILDLFKKKKETEKILEDVSTKTTQFIEPILLKEKLKRSKSIKDFIEPKEDE